MKKLFYFATVLLSVSLFSCSSDDDKEVVTSEGYVVKEVTVTSEGTQSKPLAGGKELTVTGSFATNSDIYIRPYTATRAEAEMDKNAVKLEVAERTTGSLKIKTPFLYGKYELLEKEGTKIYTLGAVYFKNAKRLVKMEGDFSLVELQYSNNKLTKIMNNGKFGGEVTLNNSYTFTYNEDGQITKLENLNSENQIVSTKEFTYSGNTGTMVETANEVSRTFNLTFNAEGKLTSSVSEWESFGIKSKQEEAISYNTNGDYIKFVRTMYIDGEKESVITVQFEYDTYKPAFDNQDLTSEWFWAYHYTGILDVNVGSHNIIKRYDDAGSWSLNDNFAYDYDDDLYPTARYKVENGEKGKKPLLTFIYE